MRALELFNSTGEFWGTNLMEEQSTTIRYMVTRSCLEEGIMRLLKYNQHYFPQDGIVKLTDDHGNEYDVEIDHENMCVWNLGPLYDDFSLGVNDVLLLHPVTAQPPYSHFWVSAEIDPHQSSINRNLQGKPKQRARSPLKKKSMLPKVGELLTPPWGLPPELNPRLNFDNLDVEATLEGLPLFEVLGDLEREQHQWEAQHGWVKDKPLLEEEIIRPDSQSTDAELGFARSSMFGPTASQTPNIQIPWDEIGQNFESSLPLPEPITEKPTTEEATQAPTQPIEQPKTSQSETDLENFEQTETANDDASKANNPLSDDQDSKGETSNFLSELIEREVAREEALAKETQEWAAKEKAAMLAAQTALVSSSAQAPTKQSQPDPTQDTKPDSNQLVSPVTDPAQAPSLAPSIKAEVFSAKVAIPEQATSLTAKPDTDTSLSQSEHLPDTPELQEESDVKEWHETTADTTSTEEQEQLPPLPKEQPLEEPLDIYRDQPLAEELSYQPEGFKRQPELNLQAADTDAKSASTTTDYLGDFAYQDRPVDSTERTPLATPNKPAANKSPSQPSKRPSEPTSKPVSNQASQRPSQPTTKPAGPTRQRVLDLPKELSELASHNHPLPSSLLEQVAEFAQLTGYRLEQLGSNLIRLNADLGPQFGYRVLLALDRRALEQAAWKQGSEEYHALLVSESESYGKIPRLTKEALLALIEHARLAPLSPVDLHGYWRSGSLDLEGAASISTLANAYLSQRGTFSYVLLALAGQQANSVITLSRLAVRLGSGVNTDDLRAILDTLSKPPFLALTALPNGQYILRRSMPEMLEELVDYSQTMRRKLRQQLDLPEHA